MRSFAAKTSGLGALLGLLALAGASASASAATFAQAKSLVAPAAVALDTATLSVALPVAAGDEIAGELAEADATHPADGTRFDVYSFSGKRGELVTVTMDAAEYVEFLFATPKGAPEKVLDAATPGRSEERARLSFELPEDGEYWIFANALSPAARGAYTLGLASAPPVEIGGAPEAAGRFALIAAISDYPGAREDLAGPEADAELMIQLLVERFGFARSDILVLRDKRVTRDNLLRGIRDHLGRAGPLGLAVFYYSGHGVALPSDVANVGESDAGEQGGDEALYLADGGLLVDDEVASLSAALPAGRLLVLFDSCFSGGTFMGASADDDEARGVVYKTAMQKSGFMRYPGEYVVAPGVSERPEGFAIARPGRVFTSASSESERSWTRSGWRDLDGRAAGIFTIALWRILRDRALAEAPIGAVLESVRVRTMELAAEAKGIEQTPTISGDTSLPLDQFLGR